MHEESNAKQIWKQQHNTTHKLKSADLYCEFRMNLEMKKNQTKTFLYEKYAYI